MKKQLSALFVMVLVLATSLSACVNSKPTPNPKVTKNAGAPVYKVTKSTGLYDAANLDAGLIAELSEGTLLKPANDEKFYDCKSLVEAGTTYTLCHVEVIANGKGGWVLQKWTASQ